MIFESYNIPDTKEYVMITVYCDKLVFIRFTVMGMTAVWPIIFLVSDQEQSAVNGGLLVCVKSFRRDKMVREAALYRREQQSPRR